MSGKPTRVRSSRVQGSHLPSEAVSVARSAAGAIHLPWNGVAVLARSSCTAVSYWSPDCIVGLDQEGEVIQHAMTAPWQRPGTGFPADFVRQEFRGRHLARRCAFDQSFHTDALLESRTRD